MCHNENIFTDEPMQYHAGTYDSAPHPGVVRSYPMNEFLFVPKGTHIGRQSTKRVTKFELKQSVQA